MRALIFAALMIAAARPPPPRPWVAAAGRTAHYPRVDPSGACPGQWKPWIYNPRRAPVCVRRA
jgi:hypothetical protein